MPWRKKKNLHVVLVAAWLTLSVCGVIMSWMTWKQLEGEFDQSARSVALSGALDRLMKLHLDMETSQRGFAITGDASFLRPYSEATNAIPGTFDRLISLVQDQPGTVSAVVELNAQSKLLQRYYTDLVQLRRTNSMPVVAQQILVNDTGKSMETFRDQIRRLKERPVLKSEEGEETRIQLLRAEITSLFVGALGVGAGLIAYVVSRAAMIGQERELKLIHDMREAEKRNEMKTTFLANVSHEIRTPMNAILGFTEILERQLPDERHREHLRSIKTSGEALLQLINDVLDLSRIEAGKLEFREEPVDPREFARFVQSMFSELAAKKGISLTCHFAEELPHAILVDQTRIRQILVNLVGNAVKFTEQGGVTVRFQGGSAGGDGSRINLEIKVGDSGAGIPPDRQEAIFRPFTQAGENTEVELQGTGLGLSIVKRLVEAMGGTVALKSRPGSGTEFTVTLPQLAIATSLPLAERRNDAVTVDFNRFEKAAILVADDNQTNRRLIKGMFAGSHHELHFAVNGEEVIERARELKPDAILMDIRMPKKDGLEALKEIRGMKDLALTPIVAVTASTLMRERENLRAGFSGYLRKPFSSRDLYRCLTEILPANPGYSTGDTRLIEGGGMKSPPVSVAEWRVALEPLAELERTTWPSVKRTMSVNEVSQFAESLLAIAKPANCSPLVGYGNSLIDLARAFKVDEMEAAVLRFPEELNAVRERINRDSQETT